MLNKTEKEFSIRRFNVSDIDAVILLVSDIQSSEDLRALAHAQFVRELEENRPDEARFVAEYAGAVVGTMGCGRGPIPSKHAAWADWLIVDPKFRRRKIATGLYLAVENFVRELGKRYLCLDIGNIDAERAAYSFHLRNGFQIIGQMSDYWGELEHLNIMAKFLLSEDRE